MKNKDYHLAEKEYRTRRGLLVLFVALSLLAVIGAWQWVFRKSLAGLSADAARGGLARTLIQEQSGRLEATLKSFRDRFEAVQNAPAASVSSTVIVNLKEKVLQYGERAPAR